ncbi:hypothetical protein SCP_0806370 [Sparassis crispa]|uniref:Uncharacterized protein n=1 Tax=Sparassis crispa TaxID=139825 RepID=A0A401GV97_9APHY|nr:hypothetical protein SCP_0806370 [Sparassis crispa]GBE86113.1 hypothetical protein SCP_0806370 [Sparassis crispa]
MILPRSSLRPYTEGARFKEHLQRRAFYANCLVLKYDTVIYFSTLLRRRSHGYALYFGDIAHGSSMCRNVRWFVT